MEYDFDVHYKKGINNYVPDFTSRISNKRETTNSIAEEIPCYCITGEEDEEMEIVDNWEVQKTYFDEWLATSREKQTKLYQILRRENTRTAERITLWKVARKDRRRGNHRLRN